MRLPPALSAQRIGVRRLPCWPPSSQEGARLHTDHGAAAVDILHVQGSKCSQLHARDLQRGKSRRRNVLPAPRGNPSNQRRLPAAPRHYPDIAVAGNDDAHCQGLLFLTLALLVLAFQCCRLLQAHGGTAAMGADGLGRGLPARVKRRCRRVSLSQGHLVLPPRCLRLTALLAEDQRVPQGRARRPLCEARRESPLHVDVRIRGRGEPR